MKDHNMSFSTCTAGQDQSLDTADTRLPNKGRWLTHSKRGNSDWQWQTREEQWLTDSKRGNSDWHTAREGTVTDRQQERNSDWHTAREEQWLTDSKTGTVTDSKRGTVTDRQQERNSDWQTAREGTMTDRQQEREQWRTDSKRGTVTDSKRGTVTAREGTMTDRQQERNSDWQQERNSDWQTAREGTVTITHTHNTFYLTPFPWSKLWPPTHTHPHTHAQRLERVHLLSTPLPMTHTVTLT